MPQFLSLLKHLIEISILYKYFSGLYAEELISLIKLTQNKFKELNTPAANHIKL